MIKHKNKQTKLEKLRFKVWMQKITTLMYISEKKRQIKQKIFCSRGYHKITSGSMARYNHPKGDIEVDYLYCKICGTLFFRNIEDKNKYAKLHETSLQKWYSNYLKEQELSK